MTDAAAGSGIDWKASYFAALAERGCLQAEVRALEEKRVELNVTIGERDAEIERLRGSVAEMMYVGNRLVRGQATADEWHNAVRKAAPAPICTLRAETTGDRGDG